MNFMKNNEYLGEYLIDIKDTPFKDYNKENWALYFIEKYGQIEGSHHKAWVLDIVSRILLGTEIIIKHARWTNGNCEYRISLGDKSNNYIMWVQSMKGEYDEEQQWYQYEYDEGIAP